MEKMTRVLALLFVIATCVSACDSGQSYDASAGPEAYEYKGAVDPLTNISGADRAGDLAARFDKVQGRM